jgi:glycogen phosphorylase
VAIQMNDTHPALAVAELMRILLDQAHLSWEDAWHITRRTLAYTNHTLLPEALERWPTEYFEAFIPRQLEIIYEINHRFLDEVRRHYPGDEDRAQRMSLVEEGPLRKIRMAHLAVVGSHSTNGVTPRRWLRQANPFLSALITAAIGPDWITDLSQLRGLLPLAKDAGCRAQFRAAKRAAKVAFADWLKASSGQIIDPDTIFDAQVKRIHEYKRQLLNVLHIIVLYNRLRDDPDLATSPHTFLFAGKAAPAYHLAELIIKRINNVAATINGDPLVHGRLRGGRNRQHEIHDERRIDHRDARRSHDRDGARSR